MRHYCAAHCAFAGNICFFLCTDAELANAPKFPHNINTDSARHGAMQRRSAAAVIVLLAVRTMCGALACSTKHWVSDATKGVLHTHPVQQPCIQTPHDPSDRQGIAISINVLSSAHAVNTRLKPFALQSLPLLHHHLNRSAIEITVAFEAGTEHPSHAAQLPDVDNLLYMHGNTPGDRFVSLVNHVGQLAAYAVPSTRVCVPIHRCTPLQVHCRLVCVFGR